MVELKPTAVNDRRVDLNSQKQRDINCQLTKTKVAIIQQFLLEIHKDENLLLLHLLLNFKSESLDSVISQGGKKHR